MDNSISPAMSNLMLPENVGMDRSKNTLGKEDFLKLLLTQMQNQDPMKPMEHQEFTAQLAQFSSLEQLSNIGKGIEGMHVRQDDGTRLQALSMIGKKIQATQKELHLVEGKTVSLSHNFADDVKPHSASIYDAQGNLVREISLKPSESKEIIWDGKDNNGIKLPTGNYGFRIQGTDSKGVGQEASGEVSGVVTGVEVQGKVPLLVLDNGHGKTKITLDKVSQVSVNEEKTKLVENKDLPAPTTPTKEEVSENIDEMNSEFEPELASRFSFPLMQP